MDDGINIKVSIDDSDVYRKLKGLRDSIKQLKDQLAIDVMPKKAGGLTEADFKAKYGFAKKEHGKYLKDLDDLDKSYAKRQKDSTVNNLVNAQYDANEKIKKIRDKDVKDSEKAARAKATFEQRANLSTQQHNQRLIEDEAKTKNRINVANAKSENNLNEINAKNKGRIDAQNNASRNRMENDAHRQRLTNTANEAKHRMAQENIILRTNGQAYLIQMRQRMREEERAAREAARAQAQQQRVMSSHTLDAPSVRYAFYDIAQNAQIATQAIFGFGVAAVKAAADYETAFTDIERTTLGTVEELASVKNQIIAISEQVPIAFAELSKIASIGAQLGLSTSDVAGFARTVSEFSAASNVSSEAAATAFGTIGELFNIAAGDYDKLGSAIAFVGVNSTATESQIISVSEAIAGVAAAAGFSADEAVGLSGALASLKVPAEQSRGALTRIFQEVSRSAAGSGTDMENFAKILGVSTDEARNLAATDMQSFFMKFIAGLEGMDVTTLTGTLDALNLSDVRVANTLSRLSGNLDVVSQAMSNSNKAYTDGTFLSQVYGLRVEDLNSKIQILINDLTTMMSKIGEAVTPTVGPVIDALSQMAEAFNDALSTDAGKAFAGTGAIILGVVGSFTALLGVAASLAAAISLTEFTVSKLGTAFTISKLKKAQDTAATVINTAATEANATANVSSGAAIAGSTSATRANTVATAGNTAAQEAEAVALTATGAAATGASVAMRAFKIALLGTGIGAVVLLLGELAAAFTQAGESADIQFQNLVTDTSGLSAALGADKKARDEALAAGNIQLASTYVQVERSATSNTEATKAQLEAYEKTADFLGSDAVSAVNDYNNALDSNNNYIGENTRAWLKAQLLKSQDFQKFITDNPTYVEAFEQLGGNFDDYLMAAVTNGQAGIDEYFTGLINAMIARGGDYANKAYAVAQQLGIAMDAVTNAASGGKFSSTASKNLSKNSRNRAKATGGNVAANNSATKAAAEQANKFVLGAANTFKIFASEADNATDSGNQFDNSLTNIGDSASGAAEKIYLLTDYAGDLAQIWERARDIRFSGTETLDKITSSFQKIAKATEDARQQIAELNADIQELQADKALQEYFLKVAEAYGDTLKAQEIRANLAKIDTDLTKKTKDLQKAQDKTNKTLTGNSEAAIDNRSEILDLVKTYQDHIKALAASGVKEDELRAKTAQLKQDFIAQATQLGYNTQELNSYTVAFDDVRAAIDNVPRDVTVDFNGDPALTAIQEFAAKARDAISGAGGTIKPEVDDSQIKKLARGMAIQASIISLTAQMSQPGATASQKIRWSDKIQELKDLLNSNQYAVGGYVSGPGSSTSDSIPARLSNGEYVIRAAAVQKYGVGFFDGLNQMRSPQYFSGGVVGSAGMGGVVSLSPEDRALLRNIGGSGEVILYANNEAIARSANAGNKMIVAAGGRP